ncbi:MAG: FecR domain-containing protein [Cyanobacteria bacterium]|nr:FecR domain-containing protein [Cyanobacteriota bacterium]MDW8200119.1 FecR domain-containing protein [Cyanobacteriota bacterium SKYGB_h_bin112]
MSTFMFKSLSLLGLLVTALAACNRLGIVTNPSPPPEAPAVAASTGVTSSPPLSSPIAVVSEILRQPVWVRPAHAQQEVAAQEGMGLQAGETVRTQGDALAQIEFATGLAFRLGKNSVITIQPDRRLKLQSGAMITWVQPGKTVPAEIVTDTAIAGIRGTTVFVNIPTDPKTGTLFFAWEGQVSVRLPNQPGELLLKTGEEVRVWRGERDLERVRRRVRRLKSNEWQQRLRQRDNLLRGFRKALPTLKTIEIIKPGQITPGIR